jgi:hypothetical protein
VRWPGERENVTTTQKFLQVAEFITLSYATWKHSGEGANAGQILHFISSKNAYLSSEHCQFILGEQDGRLILRLELHKQLY